MQFPSYDMCSSMLLLFLPQEIRLNSSGGRLQEVKNNTKSLNSQPQLVVAGAYSRDSNCKTSLGGFWCFGQVVAHGGSTVLQQSKSPFRLLVHRFCATLTNSHPCRVLAKRSIILKREAYILDAPGLLQYAATNLYRRKYH